MRLVDLLKRGDQASLSRHIVGPYVDEDGLTVLRAYDSNPELKFGQHPPGGRRFEEPLVIEGIESDEVVQLVQEGGVGTEIREYIRRQANQRLEEHASPRLLLAPDGSRLGFHVAPRNLLGALWIQLAQDVDSERSYRKCAFCSNWFELLPRMRRRNTVYCSRSCRNAAYRDRQEQARRLRARGKSFAMIAKQLGSDPATVRGWVEGKD